MEGCEKRRKGILKGGFGGKREDIGDARKGGKFLGKGKWERERVRIGVIEREMEIEIDFGEIVEGNSNFGNRGGESQRHAAAEDGSE